MASTSDGIRVRFARRSTRGVLLGMSWPQLVVVALALTVFVLAIYLGGGTTAVRLSPAWLGPLLIAFVRVNGRAVIEWTPVAVHFSVRLLRRQTSYRATPTRPRPVGTLALPGDAARLRQYVHEASGAVMVHDPHARSLTAGVRVHARNWILAEPAEQDRRAAEWGNLLASVCSGSGHIGRLQVLERTLPESGESAEAYWREHGRDDGSWMSESYKQLLTSAAPASERHETLISLTLDMKAAARSIRDAGGGVVGAAEVLAQQLSLFAVGLAALELRYDGWLTPADLAVILRGSYDPGSSDALAKHAVGRDLRSAGPLAIEEDWGHFRADSAWHCVLWVSEWPRVDVPVNFLWPLLLTSGVRRTVSVTMEPVPQHDALKDVSRELIDHESDARQRAKFDMMTTERQRREWSDAHQREAELAGGAGDMRYAGFVVVTASDHESLKTAVQHVTTAAARAHCELRVLWGEQAQAFTAGALPLGRGLS